MDEADMHQSATSLAAIANSQQQSNGRPAGPSSSIPVTVAAAAAAAAAPHSLTLALPTQAKTGHGREDCWSEGATATLIEAWGERYLELNRGNLKQRQWEEVADAVSGREGGSKPSKTDVQCKNRIDTLKKKYKIEKGRLAAGGGPSKWPFFQKLDYLIGPRKAGGLTPSPPPLVTMASKTLGALRSAAAAIHHHQHSTLQGSDRNSASSKSSPDSTDSFPPETINHKKRKFAAEESTERRSAASQSIKELTRAILKFGEVYERVESSKLQQIVDMEKQRLGFTKELELQRMQFFVKTQLEMNQMKHSRHGNNYSHNNNSS